MQEIVSAKAPLEETLHCDSQAVFSKVPACKSVASQPREMR